MSADVVGDGGDAAAVAAVILNVFVRRQSCPRSCCCRRRCCRRYCCRRRHCRRRRCRRRRCRRRRCRHRRCCRRHCCRRLRYCRNLTWAPWFYKHFILYLH